MQPLFAPTASNIFPLLKIYSSTSVSIVNSRQRWSNSMYKHNNKTAPSIGFEVFLSITMCLKWIPSASRAEPSWNKYTYDSAFDSPSNDSFLATDGLMNPANGPWRSEP